MFYHLNPWSKKWGPLQNNAAAVYATAGVHEKALEYFLASLELARDSGDIRAELNALVNVRLGAPGSSAL